MDAKPLDLRLLPGRAALVDAGFVLALVAIALVGFHPVFGGTGWLRVGLIGAVTGLVVAYLCAVTRQLAILVMLGMLGAAAIVSGLVFPSLATAGFLPNADSAREVLQGGLRGWHDILSVLPPVGSTGNLLAVPFAGGLLAATVSYSLALRSRRPGTAVLPPVALLVAAILVGTALPAADSATNFDSWPVPALVTSILGATVKTPATAVLVLQGVGTAVVGLLWGTLQQRRALALTGGRLARRPLATLLTLVLASTFTAAGLTQLTAVDAAPRVVLRDKVLPPFDPSQYGSPLAGFRRYTNSATKKDELFRAENVPAGTPIRLGTMDAYDGLVWNVAGAQVEGRSASGWFERAGANIAPESGASGGTPVTITDLGLDGVWVPTVADLTGARLQGDEDPAAVGNSGLFVNAVTGTLAMPRLLSKGTTVDETVALPKPAELGDLPAAAQPEQLVQPTPVSPSVVQTTADAWTQDAKNPRQQLDALVTRLKHGYHSSGALAGDPDLEPGHGSRRISDFLGADTLVGNDEQYAAALALMLRSVHIPARVVVGFTMPSTGDVVHGTDAHAWVEVPFTGRPKGQEWVPVFPTPTRQVEPQAPKPKPQSKIAPDQVPPLIPRSDPLPPRNDDHQVGDTSTGASGIWLQIIVWVVSAIGLLALISSPIWLLLAYKARRRRARRTRGDAAQRIARGWDELVDLSADLGQRVPVSGTRREQAAGMPLTGATQLAVAADAATFAATPPAPERAAAYWEQLRAERAGALATLSRRKRLRAKLSPASIRPPLVRRRFSSAQTRSRKRQG